MKIVFALFGLLALVIVAGKVALDYVNTRTLPFIKQSTVTINNQAFIVSVAKTPQEKEVGLSNRASLASGSGMLFQFDGPGFYSFWMKNMKFPIDMIFIKDKKVVTVLKNLQPPPSETNTPAVYSSDEPSDAVLEINAGSAEKYKIKKGDEVKLSL